MSTSADVVAAAATAGITVAVAESLTGGALCSAIVSVPGASQVLRGGVVAYTVEAKHALLGVPETMLEEIGPVSEPVALAMAEGVRARLGSDVGVSTTGVAGPDPHDGQEPGTVWIGVSTAAGSRATLLALSGDRDQIRAAAVAGAVDELFAAMSEVSHA